MGQKNLNKLHPMIDGGKNSKFGFGKLTFIPTDTEPTAVEGVIYFDDSENKFKMCTDGATWTAIAAASAATTGLDGAYDLNNTITVDGAALTLTATSTTYDTFQINGGVNTAAAKALVDLVWTGTPNATANMLRLDASGVTTTNTPYMMEFVAGSKDIGAIYIDTDAATDNQVEIHNDGIVGAGKACLYINNDGDINATGTLLKLDATGSTGSNTAYTAIIDSSGIDMAGLYIDSDAATDDAVVINGGGAIADNKALLDIVADGTPAATGSNLLRVDASGLTDTNKPTVVEVVGTGKDVIGLAIDTDSVGNVALINGGGNIADNLAVLTLTADGATQSAGGCVLILNNSGTPDTDSRALEIIGTGKDYRAVYIDVDSATNDGVYILNQGDIAASKAAVKIDIDGDINATANAFLVDGTGATMTNTPYLVKFDTSTKDAGALYIDTDAATDHGVVITGGGATAENKALLSLIWDGTPAHAGANMLRLDCTGADTTVVPVLLEIDAHGETAQAMFIDTDTTADGVLINGGGAITNGNAVLALTNDGNLATGGNVFSIDVGGTPHAAAIAFELQSAKDCQAMFVNTAAATDSAIEITGTGAVADNKALLELNWTSTPAAAGSNMLRVDGSGGTNTAKPVLVEIYDDSVSVGLSVSTASIEDMVTFIGTGATGSAKAVVDITSTAKLNASGNLLRLDLTGADTSSVPTALEVVGAGETARGIYVDTDGTTVGAAAFHSGGALTDGVAVVNITNDGNLATGGNLLNVTMGGTPHTAAAAVEIVASKDAKALDITTSAATNSAVKITGVGAVANDMALLHVSHGTGAIVAGGSIVRIEGNANAGGATAYGMTINCDGTNLEGLWVEAGTVLIAEQLTATGGVVTKLGTTADLTNTTPTSAEFDTAFGVANKTKGGFIGVVEDSGSGVAYIVFSDGTTWHFCTGTGAAA